MKKVMIAVGQLTGGGAERVATVWANGLADAGYEVSVLSYFPSDNEYPLKETVKVCRVAESKENYLRMSFLCKYAAIRRLIKQQQVDYIIPFLLSMQVWIMITTLGLSAKRIETIRINPWRVNIPNALQRSLWKLCYITCSDIILQSSDQALFFSKRQQKKSVVIPNPLSDVYLENYKVNITSLPKRFVAAGRISEQKNYPMMIRAFSEVCKRNPEATLCIYGTGDAAYVERIQGLIASEGMLQNIFLMGRVPHMEQVYRKHDVFLMTSDYEGLPNALAEAMASRLVCISTDCKTGPRDLIDEGTNGFLVPVGDCMILQQKIETVLAMSPEELDKVAGNAREKALTYCSCENSVERVRQLLV